MLRVRQTLGACGAILLSPFAYFISSRSSLPIRAMKQIGCYSGFMDEQIEMKQMLSMFLTLTQSLSGRDGIWIHAFFQKFIWLHHVGSLIFVQHVGSFSVAIYRIFSCSTWDLVPWPGIEPCPHIRSSESWPPGSALGMLLNIKNYVWVKTKRIETLYSSC